MGGRGAGGGGGKGGAGGGGAGEGLNARQLQQRINKLEQEVADQKVKRATYFDRMQNATDYDARRRWNTMYNRAIRMHDLRLKKLNALKKALKNYVPGGA